MRKKSILVLMCLWVVVSMKAQVYKKVFFKTQTIENSEIKISIVDAVATLTGTKFKMIIYNKTKDYLIYNPNESAFVIDGKKINPVEKYLIVRPVDNVSIVLDLKGKGYVVPADYDFIIEGLGRVKIMDGILNTTNSTIPSKSEFTSGGFTVKTGKVLKRTPERVDAQYVATYTGDKIGIFEPNKVFMKLKDEKEYINYHADRTPLIFPKGYSDDFFIAWKLIPTSSGDISKDDMTIIWKEAFREVVPEKMKSYTIKMPFDKETSDLKGQ